GSRTQFYFCVCLTVTCFQIDPYAAAELPTQLARDAMKYHIRTNTIARNTSTVGGLLVGLLIGSCFGSTVVRAADDVLAIARQRSLCTGGKYRQRNGAMPTITQAFAHFRSPQRHSYPHSTVIVHAGSQRARRRRSPAWRQACRPPSCARPAYPGALPAPLAR